VPEALRRLARGSRETVEALDAFVRPRVRDHLTATPVGWRLALAAFEGLLPGAVKAALRLALVEVTLRDRLGSGLRVGHLDALAALLGARAGARVRLPRGVVVERGRDALWLLQPEPSPTSKPLAVPGEAWAGALVQVTAAIEAGRPGRPADPAWEAWFDAEALGPGAGGATPSLMPLLVPSTRGAHDPVRRTPAGTADQPAGRCRCAQARSRALAGPRGGRRREGREGPVAPRGAPGRRRAGYCDDLRDAARPRPRGPSGL
jgi:hypothetical protein